MNASCPPQEAGYVTGSARMYLDLLGAPALQASDLMKIKENAMVSIVPALKGSTVHSNRSEFYASIFCKQKITI